MPRFCALLSTLPALEDLQLLCTISAIGITAWTMDNGHSRPQVNSTFIPF